MSGNIENLFGVAQIPIGLAGPLLVNGEHAQGEFYVPMATVEGTLVASYNRGMRVIRESGGVLTTVCADCPAESAGIPPPPVVVPDIPDGAVIVIWLLSVRLTTSSHEVASLV